MGVIRMAGTNNPVLVYDAILREGENAFLIEVDNEDYWIPKSQIKAPYRGRGLEVGVAEEGDTIEITKWIAKTKGLIDESW